MKSQSTKLTLVAFEMSTMPKFPPMKAKKSAMLWRQKLTIQAYEDGVMMLAR